MGIFSKLFGQSERQEDTLSGAVFVIEDKFSLGGRGTVVVGKVTQGCFSVGDKVKIKSASDGSILKSAVTGIEINKIPYPSASAGGFAALLLSGIKAEQVDPGDLILK